jgi:hypothetical protein
MKTATSIIKDEVNIKIADLTKVSANWQTLAENTVMKH